MFNVSTISKEQKLNKLNFWASNKSLTVLLWVLVVSLMVLLHQSGILVMTARNIPLRTF